MCSLDNIKKVVNKRKCCHFLCPCTLYEQSAARLFQQCIDRSLILSAAAEFCSSSAAAHSMTTADNIWRMRVKADNGTAFKCDIIAQKESNIFGLYRPMTHSEILTGGPRGPRSPLSQPHLLRARGHFKCGDRRVRWAITGMKGNESRNMWKCQSLDTHPFICQCCLWRRNARMSICGPNVLHMVHLNPSSRHQSEAL